MLGRNEKELLAYDEYDSKGSGEWFTDNPIMANEYNYHQAVCEASEQKGLDIYFWEATYDTDEKKIIKEKLWLQFTKEEAAEMKKEYENGEEKIINQRRKS